MTARHRPRFGPFRVLASALGLAVLTAGSSAAACRQALVMALDVSSSVDAEEYHLQMRGLAEALGDPEVRALLLGGGPPVNLAVFEWAGRSQQRLILDWTAIEDDAALDRVTGVLLMQRRTAGTSTTAIGAALAYAGQLIKRAPDCWERTVDLSGDGKNNDGPRPLLGKRHPVFDRITVNGLVIGMDFGGDHAVPGEEIGELSSYFRAEIMHGPDAFLESALGFSDFGAAMKRKLLRELSIAIAMNRN